MKNIIKPGERFVLRKNVTKEDLKRIGYSSLDHVDWILSQKSFVRSLKDTEFSYNKNHIYYKNEYRDSYCYFDLDMVEPFIKVKKTHNHLLTNMFARP